jgi:hypothetical protein
MKEESISCRDFYHMNECATIPKYFRTVDRGAEKRKGWRTDYYEFRLHSSLDNRTPSDYAKIELLSF